MLSQCQGLKQALAVVCHFFNIFLLILHPQCPAYKKILLVFYLFAAAVLSGLGLLLGNLSSTHG